MPAFCLDRKSTRLNSSHLVISYAGLLLKSEEHTSELQSPCNLVCRLLLEKKSSSEHAAVKPASGTPSIAFSARLNSASTSGKSLALKISWKLRVGRFFFFLMTTPPNA